MGKHFRIYVDESGTNAQDWFVIGMLFVPDHGPLHSALCKIKEHLQYFNHSPKNRARYRETHLSHFRSPADLEVGCKWVDVFLQHTCYFRSIVVDWSIWDGRYFGKAFEPESLKKRRAYKKWAEMLLHHALRNPPDEQPIYHAHLFLDRLRVLMGYDVLDHLKDRFTANYRGVSPYIESFTHTDSARDANQCLQLCDLLTGCVYQALCPAKKQIKQEMKTYMEQRLQEQGIQSLESGFWRQYSSTTLTQHFPKFSIWFWKPNPATRKGRRRGDAGG